MDTLSFINSKAIKEHLREIGYSFNSLETAWLIYSCRHLSLEEKENAWKELIAKMPDCVVPKRDNCRGWESLHTFLEKYMKIMDSEVDAFYTDEDDGAYVYMYSYLYRGDSKWAEQYETIYPSLKKCLEAYRDYTEEADETDRCAGSGVSKLRIKKQSLTDPQIVSVIECRGDGKITDIVYSSNRDEAAKDVINNSFEGLWFDFPTPFQKGDIVRIPNDRKNCGYDYPDGFVLLGLSTWNPSERIKESGDNSDMHGYGYFVNDNGTIFREVMHNYMDFEFYDGPYELQEQILPALSRFVKGDLEVDILMSAYRKVLFDTAAVAGTGNYYYFVDKIINMEPGTEN